MRVVCSFATNETFLLLTVPLNGGQLSESFGFRKPAQCCATFEYPKEIIKRGKKNNYAAAKSDDEYYAYDLSVLLKFAAPIQAI